MADRDASAGAGLIAALVRSGYKRFRYRAAVQRLLGLRPTEVQAIARSGRYGTPVPPARRPRPAAPARTSPPDRAGAAVVPVARGAELDAPAGAEPRPWLRPLEVTHTAAATRVASAVRTLGSEALAVPPPAPHTAPTPQVPAAPPVVTPIQRSPDRARSAAPPVVEVSSKVTAGAPAADLATGALGHRPAAPPAGTCAAPPSRDAGPVSPHAAPRTSMPHRSSNPQPTSNPQPASISRPAALRTAAEGLSNPVPARAANPASAAVMRAELPSATNARSARMLDAARAPSLDPATVAEAAAQRPPSTELARHGQVRHATAEPPAADVRAGFDARDALGRAAVAPLGSRRAAMPRTPSIEAKLHGRLAELVREVAALRQGQREAAAPAPEAAPRPVRQVRARGPVQPPSDARWARRHVGPLRFRVSR